MPTGPHRHIYYTHSSVTQTTSRCRFQVYCYRPAFIDPVNIIAHKATVFNCLCFLSWRRTAPLLGGLEILSCDVKPCPSERLLTLFNMSARFFMSITQMKWFALCVNHTFRWGMHGWRQLEVTWASRSLISPGIPAISHSHLQARRIQPLFSSLWALC